jgi:hypothetical protein
MDPMGAVDGWARAQIDEVTRDLQAFELSLEEHDKPVFYT